MSVTAVFDRLVLYLDLLFSFETGEIAQCSENQLVPVRLRGIFFELAGTFSSLR